jgi:EAL domain-containing protein (putative c-di-GMP-specific phosphodiesterase class I)
VDSSFIQDILNDPTDLALVKSMDELGHVYGKRTIAEYVESPEILQIVKSLSIDYAQGYCIGMPVTFPGKPVLKIVN